MDDREEALASTRVGVDTGHGLAPVSGRHRWTLPLTGALAGAASALVFAAIHALLISDIWFFLMPMLVAGAISGLCLGETFGILVPVPTLRTWIAYNATYIALLALLGAVSVVVYEPVTTINALLVATGPPEHLFREAMPLTVAFTVGAAALVTAVFGRGRWWAFVPVLVTTAVLMLFLGLNLSVMGLVEIPTGSLYVVAENFGLIVALAAMYAAVLVALEWWRFRPRT